MSDYEIDYDLPCPKCGNECTHWRDCTNLGCEDGYEDLYDDDPINFAPGEYVECQKCHGTGIERWCPKCGTNIMIVESDGALP